ncbi:hypothetical protein GXB85_04230 [Cellulomonas sp. APG4]|uniref:hypothetical protein n=1 Tax=Cellulomonas sp. APG4 TaxID=1538656 RepID=UPI00137A27B9|nr:hypothetical protein [Cellulomonas sp. APG4]NCT90161.1 hypothetical protein [Cellulomonas sp. APG4]
MNALAEQWLEVWPRALAAWGRPTRMHRPTLHEEPVPDAGSFAWFSCTDVEVHIDLAQVRARRIEGHALAALAHEVGHHVLAPGDLLTAARTAARVRTGLVDADRLVGTVANLWADLLINDRLQRAADVPVLELYAALGRPRPDDRLFQLVARTYELLWETSRGTLTNPDGAVPEDAAHLCARLVRVYARDPVAGAGGFAALVRTTLAEELESWEPDRRLATCRHREGGDQVPAGLAGDPSLGEPVVHPALDPAVVGDAATSDGAAGDADGTGGEAFGPDPGGGGAGSGHGQGFAPADALAAVRALGLTVDSAQVAAAWYREHATPHLVPFPPVPVPQPREELLGGLEAWELGDDLADVDWTATVSASPVVVPGLTTVRRDVHREDPSRPESRPVDLDLYLDSSGSMPDPKVARAPIALAGAVLALSALRAGARVQATTWSGRGQVAGTDGFTRDADAVLAAVVAHFGGGTSFPLPLLERTHLTPRPALRTGERATHVAVISDAGVISMFEDVVDPFSLYRRAEDADKDRRGDPSTGIAARAVDAAGGGGTLVLRGAAAYADRIAAVALGYDVHLVDGDEDLVRFARAFARRLWARSAGEAARG